MAFLKCGFAWGGDTVCSSHHSNRLKAHLNVFVCSIHSIYIYLFFVYPYLIVVVGIRDRFGSESYYWWWMIRMIHISCCTLWQAMDPDTNERLIFRTPSGQHSRNISEMIVSILKRSNHKNSLIAIWFETQQVETDRRKGRARRLKAAPVSTIPVSRPILTRVCHHSFLSSVSNGSSPLSMCVVD